MSNKINKTKKTIVNDSSLSFLEAYINNPSPTGFEWEGQRIWLDYINQFVDDSYTDNYGTAVGIINPDAAYKVVIEAHADEISWFVNYISNEGLIYVIRTVGSTIKSDPPR